MEPSLASGGQHSQTGGGTGAGGGPHLGAGGGAGAGKLNKE